MLSATLQLLLRIAFVLEVDVFLDSHEFTSGQTLDVPLDLISLSIIELPHFPFYNNYCISTIVWFMRYVFGQEVT